MNNIRLAFAFRIGLALVAVIISVCVVFAARCALMIAAGHAAAARNHRSVGATA